LAEAKEVQVDAQKEVDEMTGRLVASYLEAKVDEDIIAGYASALRSDGSFPDLDYVTVHERFVLSGRLSFETLEINGYCISETWK